MMMIINESDGDDGLFIVSLIDHHYNVTELKLFSSHTYGVFLYRGARRAKVRTKFSTLKYDSTDSTD